MSHEAQDAADELDEISQLFLKLADKLWDEARRRRVEKEISRLEFMELRSLARALIRRSVEIVTSASTLRLSAVQGSLVALAEIRRSLDEVNHRLEKVEDLLKVALAAVSSVTLVVASVAAPSPSTLMSAVGEMGHLVAAVAATK